MDSKQKNYLIIGFWIGYVILTFIFYNKLAQIALTGGLFIGIFIFILTNPAYIALAYYISKTSMYKFKAILASLFMAISFTIVSSPRDMLTNKILNLDTLVLNYFDKMGFNPNLSLLVYYVVLPIVFGFLALELLGIVDFVRKIRNGGV